MTPENFMAAFPVLNRLSEERWKLWRQALTKEVGGSLSQLQSYLPLWLRQNGPQMGFPGYWAELADLEWSTFWVREQSNHIDLGPLKLQGGVVGRNPLCRILHLSVDLRAWLEKGARGEPEPRTHAVLVSAKETCDVSFEIAAVLDELEEQPVAEAQLLKTLQEKYGVRDWPGTLAQLRAGEFLLG